MSEPQGEDLDALDELRPLTVQDNVVRRIACEVINRALIDAGIAKGAIESGTRSADVRRAVRQHAVYFLTAEMGPWAESREIWADVLDLDPDVIREKALKMLPETHRRFVDHSPGVNPTFVYQSSSTGQSLTQQDVNQIRFLLLEGEMSPVAIARVFNVPVTTIADIKNYKIGVRTRTRPRRSPVSGHHALAAVPPREPAKRQTPNWETLP